MGNAGNRDKAREASSAYTKEADEEDINIQATGCMFCRRLLGEGDVLWELDWDKDREKKREECLRAYRGLEKKETPGKLPDGPQGIFFMALSALRPFASEGMLPCRESEQASVMEFLKSSLRVHIKKEVLYVSGMPGTGKTASVLDAAKRLEKARSSSSNSNTPIKFAYVNAMCLSTPSAVFAEIQRKVLGQAQKRKRGPGPGGDGEEALRQALTQAGGEVVILVIDEVDALLTQGQTVLYRLFDWMSQPAARLVVVAIANTMDLPERLLPRVSSRLGIRRVNFEAYNRDQLHTILADRLRAGGAEAAIRDDALKLCAARVAAAGGDARKALQVCQAAVQRAIDATATNGKEPEAVTAAQMDKAEAELLQRNPVAVGIMNLNLKPRCFLLGMVLELRKQNAYALPLKTVTRRYEAIMRILQQRDEGAGKATQPVSSERCAWECLEYQRRLEDCCIIAQYALEQKDDGEGPAMGLGFVSSIDVSEAATALSVAPGDEIAKELLDLQPPCPYRRLS
ncbi:orc1 [Symbiodinium sp. CCMP2456]|nr:orc1 [Symbiodinium sp. CCMP2456]